MKETLILMWLSGGPSVCNMLHPDLIKPVSETWSFLDQYENFLVL
jgi:hypothetical protein